MKYFFPFYPKMKSTGKTNNQANSYRTAMDRVGSMLLLKKIFLSCSLYFSLATSVAQAPLINTDSLPISQVVIPIQINLKPIYSLAEKSVDTAFTSPNYPTGWIQLDCATRYKYHFRRSPLLIKGSGNSIQLSFTGFYQIIGSSRACIKGVAISPWTPSCSCGFAEGERKVAVVFNSSFSFKNNYQVQVAVSRKEPQPITKCTVCFWGQDVTSQVMNGLKDELDAAKKAIEDSFRVVNTRPYMQAAWNKLNEPYVIPGLGYFKLNPKKMHMENINASNDLLHINIGISASPVISFLPQAATPSLVPDLTSAGGKTGFNIYLDAALNYDSLTQVANGYLKGRRFDFKEALFKRYVIVDSCRVLGTTSGDLKVDVHFSGSHNGAASFTGKPFYNQANHSIEIADLDYDLVTKDFLLNTAKWLFNKKIISELKKATTFRMQPYYDTAAATLNTWLNKEWRKGIKSNGKVEELKLVKVTALPDHLSIQTNCRGSLALRIEELNWSF